MYIDHRIFLGIILSKYKPSAHLRHNYLTVFTDTVLEMLQRFQWIFLRVENEWNKITKGSPFLCILVLMKTLHQTSFSPS
ncbi:hypothetical protein SLEP1_g24075 [Rubroshorea leprosula]|uniref:EXS domain-containing protein n=1 Tax=Rubroshorea leprosula TaxID=152421 RepID=A0AAV5JEN3_9ROSI|nr:hypothetical protein SLEP1_g24075 [Rubroshorea leprosula]